MTQEHPERPPRRVDQDAIDDVLDAIDAEASEHGGDYAAGMRRARVIVEEELC